MSRQQSVKVSLKSKKRIKDQQVAARRLKSVSQWQLIRSWSTVAVSSILAPCALVACTVTGGNNHASALCIVLFTAVNIQECVSTRRECSVVVSFFLYRLETRPVPAHIWLVGQGLNLYFKILFRFRSDKYDPILYLDHRQTIYYLAHMKQCLLQGALNGTHATMVKQVVTVVTTTAWHKLSASS